MRVRIHGIRSLDFVSNGEKIQGTQLFFSHPSDGVIGEKTDKLFIRHGFSLPAELSPGSIVDVFCDIRGRVEAIQMVSAPVKK